MIIINFKQYRTGEEVTKLAKIIRNYGFIAAVPAADINAVSKTKVKTYAQHVDLKKGTGFVSAKSVKADGALGTLLNHSEHPLEFDVLKKTVVECKKAGLKTVVCAKTVEEARKIASLDPYAIALEEPRYIGTKTSFARAKPLSVLKFVDALKNTKILPLCGAGINSIEDVKATDELGCKGVLIASAIADANLKKADKFLKELCRYNFI